MKKIGIVVLIVLFAFTTRGNCAGADSLQIKIHLGLNGGISRNNSLSGDIFGGLTIPYNLQKIEANLGYTYFENTTDFDNVQDLLYFSHGVFAEANYFLNKNIYAGARISLNMNFVDKESQNKYDLLSIRNPPTYFTGIAAFGQIGYNQPIVKKVNLRLQGQIGLQNYRIANGALYFSNTDLITTDRYTEELQAKLIYNLTIGFIVQL